MKDRGYGLINEGGKGGTALKAHRVAWELTNGPIPKGMVICHSCDNPPCVRPDHLFLGTQRANLRDAAAKHRMVRGEANHLHKLTEGQVIDIRQRHASGTTKADLAREYELTHQNISALVIGKSWRHLPLYADLGAIGRTGERHRSARLTEQQVRTIRRDKRSGTLLATEYSVSAQSIGDIRNGKTWRHVV